MLHKLNICHNDVKLENIVYIDDSLKFIDFGLSNDFSSIKTCLGTYNYLYPQMIINRHQNLSPNKEDLILNDLFALLLSIIKTEQYCIYLGPTLFFTEVDAQIQEEFWRYIFINLDTNIKDVYYDIFSKKLYKILNL